jgi:hypothetical protein
MKKNVKIIKSYDKKNIGNYTFIDKDIDINMSGFHQNPESNVNNDSSDEKYSMKDIHKNYKKKVLSKKEINNNAIKGLKFSNPSQRNHSSVYE